MMDETAKQIMIAQLDEKIHALQDKYDREAVEYEADPVGEELHYESTYNAAHLAGQIHSLAQLRADLATDQESD
jgi:hypothetical protein